eukprot:876869-Amphidinium_carterae.1
MGSSARPESAERFGRLGVLFQMHCNQKPAFGPRTVPANLEIGKLVVQHFEQTQLFGHMRPEASNAVTCWYFVAVLAP